MKVKFMLKFFLTLNIFILFILGCNGTYEGEGTISDAFIWKIYDETGEIPQNQGTAIQYQQYYMFNNWPAKIYLNINLDTKKAENVAFSNYQSDVIVRGQDEYNDASVYVDFNQFLDNDSYNKSRGWATIKYEFESTDAQLKVYYTNGNNFDEIDLGTRYHSNNFKVESENEFKKIKLNIFTVSGFGLSDLNNLVIYLNSAFLEAKVQFEINDTYALDRSQTNYYGSDKPGDEDNPLLFEVYEKLTSQSYSSYEDLWPATQNYHLSHKEELNIAFLNEDELLGYALYGDTDAKILEKQDNSFWYYYSLISIYGAQFSSDNPEINLKMKKFISTHEIGHSYAYYHYTTSPPSEDIHNSWHNCENKDGIELDEFNNKRVSCIMREGGGLTTDFVSTLSNPTNGDKEKLESPKFCAGHYHHFTNTNWAKSIYHPILNLEN